MLDAATSFLRNLSQNVRFADLLDVALVALFLYVFLDWLRRSTSRSASRRTLIAVAFFGGVYLLARLFDLYLVESLIQVLLIVFLLAAVVAFQTDIRRLADRLAMWRPFRNNDGSASKYTRVIDVLTEASAGMAEENTGALIAILGREPWDRHIEGGILLGGTVSLPLLFSIFHPKTPGHDGAVLIEGDRISRFAAHLPLADHLPDASRHGGTRHAAALGLAEQCDALVIVVSEERGVISVAQDGRLLELASASELKPRLEAFYKAHYTAQQGDGTGWKPATLQNASLAILLAVFSWLLFAYRPDVVYRPMVVPIELRNVPPEFGLDEDIPSEARVTLAGSEQTFRLQDPAGLVATLDLANIEEGMNEFTLTEDNLGLRAGIQLYNVEPRTIRIDAEPLRRVRAPVEVQTSGTLADSLELLGLFPRPDSVTLLVPDDQEIRALKVATQQIALGPVAGTTTLTTSLVPPEGTRLLPNQPTEIAVNVQVRRRLSDDLLQ